jgi:hypothetical protein
VRVFVRRPERKRPIGRPRRRWKDNIKTDPEERDGEALSQFIWRRIRTGGGRL